MFKSTIEVPGLLIWLLMILAVHSAAATHIILNDTQECGFRNILVFNFSGSEVVNNTASFTVHAAEGSLMLHIYFQGLKHHLYNDTLNITHTSSQITHALNGSYHTKSLKTRLPPSAWTTVTLSTNYVRRMLVIDDGVTNATTNLTLRYTLDTVVVSGSNMSKCTDDAALWESSSSWSLGWVIVGIVLLICIASAISVAYDVIIKKKKMPFKPKFRPPEIPKVVGKKGKAPLNRSESRRELFIIDQQLDSAL